MVRMREWLDEHKSEPVRFVYNQYGGTLTVAVDFDNDKKAQVFENHFCAQEEFALALEEVAFGGLRGRGEKNGVEQLPDAESCPGF
jgi:hypothetical protein